MIKKISLLLVSGALLSTAQVGSQFSDISILSSDQQGITLEWRPRYLDNASVTVDGKLYSRPQFDDQIPSPRNQAGAEDIRTRLLSIACPSLMGNTVSIVAADYETIAPYYLTPVPEIEALDQFGSVKKKYSEQYRSTASFFPEQLAELRDIAPVKGITLGSLVIAPYQYNAGTRTLKRYSRIVVRVSFSRFDAPADLSGNLEWAKTTLLNFPILADKKQESRLAKKTAANSVLSSGYWVKMEVVEDGIYKIDAAYLRAVGIDPASLSLMNDVKIFGNDGKLIPEALTTPRPQDLPQIPVEYHDGNGNGRFDNDDYILFYGQGINGWTYNAATKQHSHYGNPYTFSNFYFLAVGATAGVKNIEVASISSASGGILQQVQGKGYFDEDKFNFNQSGQDWVSSPINPGESRTVSTKLFGWIAGTPVTYRFLVYGRATESTTMTLEESGQPLSVASLSAVSFDGYHFYAYPYEAEVTISPALTDQRSNVKFKYNSNSNISTGYIGWIRMFYRQQLTANNNLIDFTSPDSTGTIEYGLNGFSRNDITIFEVSNPATVRKISYQLQQQAGTLTFRDTTSPGTVKRYYACTPDQYKSPKSALKIPNSNLHSLNGADYIIITHKEFKTEAVRLQQHKESLPASKRLSTMVVEVDTIYNEFGIGMPDPSAIRDFLRYAYEQWPVKPKYVLLFGDASYDYRNILNIDRGWVPTYQTRESNVKISTYALEDYFSYISPSAPTNVAFALGRLTPRSSSDAKVIVDKIIHYETSLPKGPWKNTITIVADDMWTPQNPTETDHIYDAEELSKIAVANGYDIKRIYMEEYATVFSASGRRKPAVREAILKQVNNAGTVMINYIGHGNPKVWAHESILTLDDTRSQFVNAEKQTFIVAATCDWGRFEEAGEPSSAEEVVLNRKGGSIGVLSATRAVYASENALLNQTFYNLMFSGKPVLRMGDAYLLTKNALAGLFFLENKQKYFLLGDPTIALSVPEGKMVIDSIQTSLGAAADTMRALEKITIKGTVRDTGNTVISNFSGTAILTINDAEKTVTVDPVPGFSYKDIGATIYSGEATVSNGTVVASFIVPKDISYTDRNGRISMYFSNSTFDGRGFNKNFIVGGTNPAAAGDSVGPNIEIYFDNANFRPGDVVSENPTLIVVLSDSSGINSSTNSIGHRLEAWIDGSAKSVDLTDFYKGKVDSYQEGSSEYQLNNLSDGNHTIKVRAWDVYNNSSMNESHFVVASSNSLSIQQLYNFPNPVSTTTAITFHHNQSIPIDVTVKIYTVAGRLIHTIERPSMTERFVKIPWDRHDGDGDEVGNGIYFYKVIASTIDGKFTSEAIGKMAIVR